MKLTKTKLKQIIKEELDQEQLEKIIDLYTTGDDDNQEQAIALMRSIFAGDETQDTTGITNSVYILLSHEDEGYDGVFTNIYGVFGSRQEAQEAIERVKKEHNVQGFNRDEGLRIMAIPMGKLRIHNIWKSGPTRFVIVDWLSQWSGDRQPKIV